MTKKKTTADNGAAKVNAEENEKFWIPKHHEEWVATSLDYFDDLEVEDEDGFHKVKRFYQDVFMATEMLERYWYDLSCSSKLDDLLRMAIRLLVIYSDTIRGNSSTLDEVWRRSRVRNGDFDLYCLAESFRHEVRKELGLVTEEKPVGDEKEGEEE